MDKTTHQIAQTRPKLYESQKLALWYFGVAIALFGVQLLFGLLAAYQQINPRFLFPTLPFMMTRTIHLNTMIVWLLLGMMGGVYWFLPRETGREVVGMTAAKVIWWIIVAGLGVLLGLYLFVQYGPGEMKTIWLLMEGREYLEAPRWVDLALVVWLGIFLFNVVATVLASRRITGLLAVLIFDLVALAALYTAGMHYTVNITMDQYLWWWVVHLWVETTWEVLVGVLVAWSLMYLLGTPRRIVETWLFVEVALVFGTGILGLGHHYFWIGTPEYWLGLGGFFSALEPLPLVAMVVHAVYDAGSHRLGTVNKPAMFWVIAQAFGNFIGAGVWGFMQTLPQINMYSHGTQLAAAHGHLAFFGAYVATDLALMYIAAQHLRGTIPVPLDSELWRWAAGLMILGIIGVTAAFTLSGFVQTLVERAVGGSTWAAFIDSYTHPWYAGTLSWRFAFGLILVLGYALLVGDLFTLGKAKQRRRAG
ncbi:cbb3-type cytochrome c oxidase subunit I [Candidatus Methylacidithermus pantelleriae]|uniref:Nitric oxide reductase, subunit B n=1 Tax=Candidatus Methylacidithermus pantelleriae TaxID=2744239 RepID=A0A8J2BK38_9BACT|nr:cbb3-type cytochrome c oxidase subunit I [Candidatus Methylacidithermus pantelleriae]CAF0701726.1 Nitric oxide reductase, subunit B [Candidatus Methylacidithermus pantelleriae]